MANIQRFLTQMQQAGREEEVISAASSLLHTKGSWHRPLGTDGLHEGTLFEFKLRLRACGTARLLAQICSYLRRFVMRGGSEQPPRRVCGFGADGWLVLPASALADQVMADHDWSRPPTSPDPRLVEALRPLADRTPVLGWSEQSVGSLLEELQADHLGIPRKVTLDNFVDVFLCWKEQVGGRLDPADAAAAYISDLQMDRAVDAKRNTVLLGGTQTWCQVEAHRLFWRSFALPPDNDQMFEIYAAKDRLVAMQRRRLTGAFFTPLDIAREGHRLLLHHLPDAYDAYWWDCCAGTGNLTLDCPERMGGRVFLSTLEDEDVRILKDCGQNPGAHKFQHDFLNGTDEQLPAELRQVLRSRERLVFMINPPFAAGASGLNGEGKTGVSDTSIAKRMAAAGAGFARQNLYAQFIWRVAEIASKRKGETWLGCYSRISPLSSGTYAPWLRHVNGQLALEAANVHACSEFNGATGQWPVLFTVWRSR